MAGFGEQAGGLGGVVARAGGVGIEAEMLRAEEEIKLFMADASLPLIDLCLCVVTFAARQ